MSPMIQKIPYEDLEKVNHSFFDAYKKEFAQFLQSGWYILGEGVRAFEASFADYCGTSCCVGVASGLDALTLAINACDFPKGSEIIVPSNTYIATILAIVKNGLKPVLVEPDIETYNIDPYQIKKAITKETRAILVVHLYGKACDMDPICNIAKTHRLVLFEDCAQAHGARYKGKRVGSFGIGCFSFYPTKNLGALGDGGAITCNDAVYAEKLRSLRNYGSNKKYYNRYVGYNSRLDEIQARFLSIKLKALDDITAHKRRLAGLYIDKLEKAYVLPKVLEGYDDVYHIFNIRYPHRDKLRAYLLEKGIGTEIHYPVPPHRQEALSHLIQGEYPVSEEIHCTTLSLPISYAHSQDEIDYVIKVLNAFAKQ